MKNDISSFLFGQDYVFTEKGSKLLKSFGFPEIADALVVEWNPRMRSTAGRAYWGSGRIELNPKLMDISLEEAERTFLHELAHLLAHARAGQRKIMPHGVEWRQACVDLGIPGESVTHSLPLPRRTMKRKWLYYCPVCGDMVTRVRKMKRRVACHACCKKHNGGRYHKKFKLVVVRMSDV